MSYFSDTKQNTQKDKDSRSVHIFFKMPEDLIFVYIFLLTLSYAKIEYKKADKGENEANK